MSQLADRCRDLLADLAVLRWAALAWASGSDAGSAAILPERTEDGPRTGPDGLASRAVAA